jgi:hypothetical protein
MTCRQNPMLHFKLPSPRSANRDAITDRQKLFEIARKITFMDHDDPLTSENLLNHQLRSYYSKNNMPFDFEVMQSVIDYLCGDTGFRCDNIYTKNTNPALKRIASALIGEVYENVRWDMAECGLILETERFRTAVWHCHIIVSVDTDGIIVAAEIE